MSDVARLKYLGAIGDVHAEEDLLQAALGHLRARGAERILVVGDIVDGLGDVEVCCRLLDAPDVRAVRGNHERWFLAGEMRDLPDATPPSTLSAATERWLASLPATQRLATVAGDLLLCHGLGEQDMARVKPWDEGYALEFNFDLHALQKDPTLKLVVNGHTHLRMVRRLGPLVIINAGTLHRRQGPGFLWIDLEARQVEMYDLASTPPFQAALAEVHTF
jgi:predicted phosphodiesterase